MSKPTLNHKGEVIGDWTLLEHVGNGKWRCRCSCGGLYIRDASSMRNSKSSMCRMCWLKRNPNHTHGMCYSKTYTVWADMKQRCLNKNSKSYQKYGAKGITLCKRWYKFENFLKDMGERPEGLEIDRIDNKKGYCKKNCRWVTRKENCRNMSTTHMVFYRGKERALIDLADEFNINRQTVYNRIKRFGWSVEKALTTKPLHKSYIR